MNRAARFALLSVLIASSLAHAGETNAPSPVWYLKQLAYDVEEQWVSVDYQGDPGREVVDSRIQIRSGDALKKRKKVEGGSLPEWSASGQKIAFLGFCNGYVRCSQISVASVDGSNRKVITNSRDGVSNFSWSPREDRIAYVEQALSGPTKLLLINSDGSGGREVAKVENADCHFTGSSSRRQVWLTVTPTWSADGRALAFNTCFEGATAIAVADKDVTNVRVLVKGGHSPVWSPDGEHLLYMHGPTASDPTVSICMVGLDGKDVRKIFSAPGTPSGLTWLRHGSAIAFVSMHGNKAEVFQINVDGTGLTMIGSASDEYFSLSSPMFSPDGKKLVMSGYHCCASVWDSNWRDSDRSAVILVDLMSNQKRTIARGQHPSVLWAAK